MNTLLFTAVQLSLGLGSGAIVGIKNRVYSTTSGDIVVGRFKLPLEVIDANEEVPDHVERIGKRLLLLEVEVTIIPDDHAHGGSFQLPEPLPVLHVVVPRLALHVITHARMVSGAAA